VCSRLQRIQSDVARRFRVAAEQATLPVFQAIDSVVVSEFGRATNEQAVAYFLLIFVLRPPVAIFAERDWRSMSART
jgi:hypothetical protein